MTLTNSEMEDEWVNAWSALYELRGDRQDVVYLTPEFDELGEAEARGWLQDSAYAGFRVSVHEVWYKGQRGIQLQRSQVSS